MCEKGVLDVSKRWHKRRQEKHPVLLTSSYHSYISSKSQSRFLERILSLGFNNVRVLLAEHSMVSRNSAYQRVSVDDFLNDLFALFIVLADEKDLILSEYNNALGMMSLRPMVFVRCKSIITKEHTIGQINPTLLNPIS